MQDGANRSTPENSFIAVTTQDGANRSSTPENPFIPVSRQAAANQFSTSPENPLKPVSRQAGAYQYSLHSPENPLTPVSIHLAVNKSLNKLYSVRSSLISKIKHYKNKKE